MSDANALPLREWLELGQAMLDKCNVGSRYFRKSSTGMIEIGKGLKVKADGKTYGPGRYVFDRATEERAA